MMSIVRAPMILKAPIINVKVRIRIRDIFAVFLTVMVIGLAASWYPARNVSRKLIRQA